MITLATLKAIAPAAASAKLEPLVDPLNATMVEFDISTNERIAAFLAQLAHESDGFLYLKELASGEEYEGNSHLGNNQAGDGPRYKGRGLIQVTGRKNYGLCGEALGLDLIEHPELLEQPEAACRSAGWFWTTGAGLNLSKRAIAYGVKTGVNLNDLADSADYQGITLAINGGMNGYTDRMAYLGRAEEALG